MTREAPDLDRLLDPLHGQGAPPEFARRVSARFAAETARRQRRAALVVSAGAGAASLSCVLALGGLFGRSPAQLALGALHFAEGLVTGSVAIVRTGLFWSAGAGVDLPVLVALASFVGAACCLGIATLVHHSTAADLPHASLP